MKPIIGISCARNENGAVFLRDEYAHAVSNAGGIPYLVPHLADEFIAEQLSIVDGVIFSGGNDYSPALYGQALHPLSNPMAAARERHDLQLFAECRSQKIPTLCICAGAQLAAIHFGAEVIQDIDDFIPHARQHKRSFQDHAHALHIHPQSMLRKWFKVRHPIVNSVHHQAVSRHGLPNDLLIAAHSDDGVIEAIEIKPGSALDNGAWFCAVQWHPEHMCTDADQLALFAQLIQASGERMCEQNFHKAV